MDIIRLVDELEQVVSSGFRLPFSSNVMVNEEQVYDIIDQMRVSIPREIKEAKRTEAERQHILAQAKEEANRLENLAKEKIMAAVDDHQIIEEARVHAKSTIVQAHREAWELKLDSHAYVSGNLSDLEQHLLKMLTTVRNGLRHMQENPPPNPPPSVQKSLDMDLAPNEDESEG